MCAVDYPGGFRAEAVGSTEGVGTTSLRKDEWLESTPKYQSRWKRGGGTAGDEPGQEVIGLEHHGARSVLPRALERELEPAVLTQLEAAVCQRWATDVTAEPLELPTVATLYPRRQPPLACPCADHASGISASQ